MQNKTAPVATPSNAFPLLFAELEEGFQQEEASRQLNEVVQAVLNRGKAGKLSIVITVTPASRGVAVNFVTDITSKLPKAEVASTLMFVDSNNGYSLSKNNPSQRNLNFSEVPKQVDETPKEAQVPKAVVNL